MKIQDFLKEKLEKVYLNKIIEGEHCKRHFLIDSIIIRNGVNLQWEIYFKSYKTTAYYISSCKEELPRIVQK